MYRRIALAGICVATVATLTATDVAQVFGQRSQSRVERRLRPGRGFWANERASRNMRHARDYSQDIYYYSRGAQRIEPQVAKAESEQLGKNIDAVKKELAVVRTESAADKETLAALEAIEKHLTKAVETHKMLHAESSKDSVEGGICAKCCSEITKALEMAMAEHDALRRTLELRTQDESTRPTPENRN